MADLTIREAVTGSDTPLEDVDLTMTNKELISGLVDGGVLQQPTGGQKHLVVAKNNSISEETRSLSDLGFVSGDTIRIVTKDVGAF